MRDAFALDPSVAHLNNGSFGAVPRVVLEAQRRVRDRAEANPMRFHRVEAPALKEQARGRAGTFLDVGPDEIALVRNVTQAAATVLGSLVDADRLGPGDAIVLGEQAYAAVREAVVRCCETTGASYRTARYPIGATDDDVVATFRRTIDDAAAGGGRVRLVVVDQIASPTGAMLPVRRICDAARAAGALSLVDAAHVPGHIAARPRETGADFWAGTWHKWGFAARGTTALWVTEAERERTLPLTTGANHGRSFPLPFDSSGTDDHTGWYCIGDAIDFWHDAGGPALAERCRALLDEGAKVVASVLPPPGIDAPAAPSPCMRLLPLPDGVVATDSDSDGLYERLSALGVEVQVVAHEDRGYVRLSAAAYNVPGDYERLAEVLPRALRRP